MVIAKLASRRTALQKVRFRLARLQWEDAASGEGRPAAPAARAGTAPSDRDAGPRPRAGRASASRAPKRPATGAPNLATRTIEDRAAASTATPPGGRADNANADSDAPAGRATAPPTRRPATGAPNATASGAGKDRAAASTATPPGGRADNANAVNADSDAPAGRSTAPPTRRPATGAPSATASKAGKDRAASSAALPAVAPGARSGDADAVNAGREPAAVRASVSPTRRPATGAPTATGARESAVSPTTLSAMSTERGREEP
jgi:hypothetical protein